MIVILKPCRKEIEALPVEIRGDLADALARLDAVLTLSLPLSRPMPAIGRGVHELRLRDRSGVYRVVYAVGHSRRDLCDSCVQEDHAGDIGRGSGAGAKAPEGGSVMKKVGRTAPGRLARQLGIPKSRGMEAVLKAQLIAAIVREVARRGLTHADVAARSGLSRSAVTGILSGSLQKVTIDRVLRLLEAVGLEASVKVRRAA